MRSGKILQCWKGTICAQILSKIEIYRGYRMTSAESDTATHPLSTRDAAGLSTRPVDDCLTPGLAEQLWRPSPATCLWFSTEATSSRAQLNGLTARSHPGTRHRRPLPGRGPASKILLGFLLSPSQKAFLRAQQPLLARVHPQISTGSPNSNRPPRNEGRVSTFTSAVYRHPSRGRTGDGLQ